VLGEAVLGHCSSAEKIDLTRFWNWQDSPGDEATAITGVTLRPSGVGDLTAPNALGAIPPIINNVSAGGEGGAVDSALAQALAAGGAAAKDFDTAFLGHDVLKELGGKTIQSAETARADALGKATQLASEAMKAAVEVKKAEIGVKDAKDEKDKAEKEKAAKELGDKQAAAVKDLKENAASYLAVTEQKAGTDAEAAQKFATGVIHELAGGALPANLATKLFAPFDKKDSGGNRTVASTAWLTALGLI